MGRPKLELLTPRSTVIISGLTNADTPALEGSTWLHLPTGPPAEGQERGQNLHGCSSDSRHIVSETAFAGLSQGFLLLPSDKECVKTRPSTRVGLFIWIFLVQQFEVTGGGQKSFSLAKLPPPGA